MPDWSTLLRPELADLSAYVPASPPGIEIRLDANEAPHNPSLRVREVVARAIAETPLERYPDARATELRGRIAERTQAHPDENPRRHRLRRGHLVDLTALARPRGRAQQAVVVTPTPTFVMYRTTARTHGQRPVEVPLDPLWDLDTAAMLKAIEVMPPNVVFIASPNNPTGTRMSDNRVAAVLDRAGDALVVVDEAYVDFAGTSLEAGARGIRAWRSSARSQDRAGRAARRVARSRRGARA